MSAANARSWLQSGQAPVDRAQEVAICVALLSGKVPLTAAVLVEGPGADLQSALVAEAEARGQWDLVALLKEHAPDKAARKLARKAMFRARQKGVVDDAPAATPQGIDLSRRPDPLPSYCTSFDGSGAQLVLLGGWSAAEDAWCAVGVVGQREGLLSTSWMPRMSRRRQRSFLDDVAQRFGGEVFEVPDGFAGGRLAWGLALADERKASVRGDVAPLRRVVAEHPPLERCDATLSNDDEAQLDALAQQSGDLLQDPAFAAWHLVENDSLRKLDAAFHERFDAVMARSEPDGGDGDGGDGGEGVGAGALAERQRAAAQEAITASAEVWLADQGAEPVADRLTLTAFLLTRSERAERRALARLAVATARHLRAGTPAHELPLIRGWTERVVASAHHHPGLDHP